MTIPMSGEYCMEIHSEGTWLEVKPFEWHVENMVIGLVSTDSYTRITCDVHFDGTEFTISSVTYVIAALEYINSNDPSKTSGVCSEGDDLEYHFVPFSYVNQTRSVDPKQSC